MILPALKYRITVYQNVLLFLKKEHNTKDKNIGTISTKQL